MKQWLALVVGVALLCLVGLLWGDPVGGSTVFIK
jgi:hypothetical protein